MAAPRISELFCAIFSAISQSLPRSISLQLPKLPPPPPPPPQADIERAAEVDANHEPFPPFTARSKSPLAQPNLNWSKIVIAFCFGSALEIAHQAQSQSHQLPSTLYTLLCFAISVSFSCMFVAHFIGSRFSMTAQVLEHVGVLFAVTAFFLAMTSPFPLSLKCIIWALYAVSLLAILISNLL